MKKVSFATWLLVLLGGCASTVDLAPSVSHLQESMNPTQADVVLNRYIKANESRGGLCLMSLGSGIALDYDEAVTASEAKIAFTGRTGELHLFNYSSKQFVLDAKRLKEIRILDKRLEQLHRWCPNIRPNFLVVLKPIDNLPDGASTSINVNSRDELDELLAALTYLSPHARLVGGIGM